MQGLLKNVMELQRCTFGDAYEWIDEQERKQMPTWRLYDILQDSCFPQILVDKTPHNADHPSFLDHAESIFNSAARYCHLVRHPYACIASGVARRQPQRMLHGPALHLPRGVPFADCVVHSLTVWQVALSCVATYA